MKYQQILSPFSTIRPFVHNINISAINLNSDLSEVSNWTFRWKTSFNPDPKKHVNFFRKILKRSHPYIYFHNIFVK